uniref:PEHE domain-containing protein n=1 Tax=Denticeps clupeoides TaxID=299321 RepID=A0AAY4CZH8_9TELE
MGGEGTPVKSKSLFGQTDNSMGKMDPVTSNRNKQPRDVGDMRGALGSLGTPPPELTSGSKWKNMQKCPSHGSSQASCIRQILLLQLELIEQQQNQLQSKSNEIDELKAEKEMLIARIERMEQRLQLIKKGNQEQRVSQTPRQKEPEGHQESPEAPGLSQNPLHTPKQIQYGRGGKGNKRALRRQTRSPVKEEDSHSEEAQDELSLEDRSVVAVAGTSTVLTEEVPYLATTEMYLCCWHQPPPSPWHDQSPTQEENVDVPSWRENIVEPLPEVEAKSISESVEDSAFRKRHSKLELGEKRRKRWDIQRIREQRIFQRLQQRMNKKKVVQEVEPELLSFYPRPEDVQTITITPFLPVVAFGRPLPKLTRQNFELPWIDDQPQARPEVSKKKTPHRTCRR